MVEWFERYKEVGNGGFVVRELRSLASIVIGFAVADSTAVSGDEWLESILSFFSCSFTIAS